MTPAPLVPTDPAAAVAVQQSKGVQTFVARAEAIGRYGDVAPFMLMALNAQSLAEATDIGDVIQAGDHLNERIRFFDATFLDSDPELKADFPVYAVADVVREMGDGTHEKMSCGAGHVVGVLLRACEMGWFPFDAELVSVPLGAGKKAINLQLAPTKVANTTDF